MPPDSPDQQLLIRCPSCGQRFNVAESLKGRLVECGECDTQFQVSDEVIVRGRKFYPGERKDPLLQQVHRVDQSLPRASDRVVAPMPVHQATPDIAAGFSPLRVIMGLAGAFSIIITALVLKLGACRGGVLDGVPTEKRLVIAAFFAFVGGALIMLANPKRRVLASLIVLVAAAGLISMPMFFRGAAEPLGSLYVVEVEKPEIPIEPEKPEERTRNQEELREFIGTEPLEAEIRRLDQQGSPLSAVGIWLRDLEYRNWLLVRDYILRETGADLRSHDYPREKNSRLFVVTGIDLQIEQVVSIAAALGEVKSVYGDLRVIEVKVDNRRFLAGPMDKLTDTSNPEFYLLNKIELESVDLDRVKSAVKRLADVEPRLFRADISKRLIHLLDNNWIDFKDDICRALMVWAEEPGPAGKVALRQIRLRLDGGVGVDEEMVALAVHEKTPGITDALKELWLRSPGIFERYYMELGDEAEAPILAMFDESRGVFRQSALRILERVGGRESLKKIEPLQKEKLDAETTVLVRNALRSIRTRVE